MLILCGFVYLDPADLDDFMADAGASAQLARSSSGCAFISFAVDEREAGRVVVAERWRSQEDLAGHLGRPEVVAIFGKWSPRMRNEVRKFDAANERDPRMA